MQRQGVCNHCGQCCGGPGGAEDRSIWPTTWYPASGEPCWRHWVLEYLLEHHPILALFGVISKSPDLIGVTQEVGSIRVTGQGGGLYHYIWVPGHSICKDTSAAHDGSSWSHECPFLLPDPGDGTRQCGLYGTKEQDRIDAECLAYPPEQASEEYVTEWQYWFPGCSYTWTE